MEGVRLVVLLCVYVLHFTSGTRTNVAENKPAWMSSAWKSTLPASTAVDGVTLANDFKYSAVTRPGETSAWWKVDLQTQVQSARVTLYFNTVFKKRRNGLQFYTSMTNSADPKEGNLCHSVTGRADGTDIPDVLSVTCHGTWRYLTLYTETDNNGSGPQLDFVEVQVWTCAPEYYGADCGQLCTARHCKMDSSCHDKIQGKCVRGCAAGYRGTDCTQACTSVMYGPNCASSCSSRHCQTPSSTCDRVTGQCPDGCEDGWTEIDCSRTCTSMMYGPNCASSCSSRHCKTPSSTCDRVTGQCPDGCEDGWTEIDCSRTCTSVMYGPNCASSCSSRHCQTPSSTCDRVTGQCPDGCEDGWTETDCSRMLANCPQGRYGPGCTKFCNSRNCKTPSPVCDVTGSCTNGCRDGWKNVDCRIPCPSGKYGSNCSRSCDSRQCETARVACDHVTGTCAAGCREGWIGTDCTQKCKPGTYGRDCSRCGHCDVTCNDGDGRCPGECLDGFTGDRCDVDVRVSPVTTGVIGGAVGIAVMLLLIGGLMICLLKAGRLKWIPTTTTDPQELRRTDTPSTGEMSTHAPTSDVNDQDYTELNEFTREDKSLYDVIQNENNQI